MKNLSECKALADNGTNRQKRCVDSAVCSDIMDVIFFFFKIYEELLLIFYHNKKHRSRFNKNITIMDVEGQKSTFIHQLGFFFGFCLFFYFLRSKVEILVILDENLLKFRLFQIKISNNRSKFVKIWVFEGQRSKS